MTSSERCVENIEYCPPCARARISSLERENFELDQALRIEQHRSESAEKERDQAVELIRCSRVLGYIPKGWEDERDAFLASLESKSSAGKGTVEAGTDTRFPERVKVSVTAPKAEDINSKRPSGHQVSYCGSNEVHEPHYGTFRGLPTNVWCPGRFTSRDVVRT